MKVRPIKKCTLIFLLSIFSIHLMADKTIILPGNIHHICYYTDFFYNLPDNDFIYYLNDRLLFSDPPNEELFDSGLRRKLLNITMIHKRLRQIVREKTTDGKPHMTLDISQDEGMKQAIRLMGFLGLELRKEENGQYKIMIDASTGIIDYYRFSRIDIEKMERQINQTKRLYFRLSGSTTQIPWDFKFLKTITGLEINAHSFFETLLMNERFSLLIAVLYRFSEDEINYINSLTPQPQVWKQIYQDKKLLMGMYLLSHALRSNDNKLILPGGDEAASFWSQLCGSDLSRDPFGFIKGIATKQDGKLNYLYVFSFFLPESSRKILLLDFNSEKMQTILDKISLGKKGKLQTTRFPRLGNFNFFTLLYALKVKDGKVTFPGKLESWIDTISGRPIPASRPNTDKPGLFHLYKALLENSSNKKELTSLQKFISLYSKFHHRPEIMTDDNIHKLFEHYQDYNILVDFIEKIPVKNPQLVSQMIDWVIRLDKQNRKDRILFTAIFQSLFEILSYQAKYASHLLDYDTIIDKLIKIPLDKSQCFDQIFDFFKTQMNIYPNRNTIDNAMISSILKGIPNQYIQMNNRQHKFMIQDSTRTTIDDILQSQEVCPLSTLIEVKQILKRAEQGDKLNIPAYKIQLVEAFNQLPHPDISDDAPRFIISRIKKYVREDLERDVQNLALKLESKAPSTEINNIITKLKSDYLIHQLQDYLLALTYALNAKNERLRIFLNPNLSRLHDFEDNNGNTPWNHCKTPTIKNRFSGFYFQGGLSRLNILFSQSWKDHLFSRNIIYDKKQIQSVILNILEFYPLPLISNSQSYIGLLTEFGLELIQKAKNNTQINQEVIQEIKSITTGYHYRKIIDFLNDKSNEYYLFFTEIFRLGENFLAKNKYLKEFSAFDKLGILTKTHLSKSVQEEIDYFGGVYYHTFGNLRPQKYQLFPQEISNLYDNNWTGGEMINEFKIKAAYHSHKKMFPPKLLGQFLYHYLYNVCRKYFSQNYIKDYFSTYFIFDILNNSHLTKILKKLQEKGLVRLK